MKQDLLRQFEAWTGMPPESLLNWDAHPVYRKGELAGIGITNGPEIHFVTAPEWRGRLMTRRIIRDFLEPLLLEHNYLVTRVLTENTTSPEFLKRLGFVMVLSNLDYDTYVLSDLPFSREI